MSDFPPPPPDSGGTPSPPPPPPPGASAFPPPPPPSADPWGAPPPGYSSTYGTTQPVNMHYAGFGARFGAWFLDGIITTLMFAPATIAIRTGPTRITRCSVDSSGNVTIGEELNALCEVPTGGTIALAALLGLAALVGAILYHTLPVGRSGQTLGKRATGVRVLDANDGSFIGSGRALGRYLFAAFISGPTCLLGYLWPLWDSRNQTWHDKVVNSVVVKV